MSRIIITGGPCTGKTTVADELGKKFGVSTKHTDEIAYRVGWSNASLEVAAWIHDPGDWIIEGCTAIRAIRRWLLHTPMTEKPADIIYYGAHPFTKLTSDQLRLFHGCNTIWQQIRGELTARGVQIEAIPTSRVSARP